MTAMSNTVGVIGALIGVNSSPSGRPHRMAIHFAARIILIDGRHREPAQPIPPGGEAPDLPGHSWAEVLVGFEGVGGQPAGPVGHHRRQLREAEAQNYAGACDEEEYRD